jgi:formate hydrogenlyase subunit 6/NADH:ubiquinone oxidoreductase subunit I
MRSIRKIFRDASDRFFVLKEMFRNLLSKPATILYPDEKVPVPE